MQHDLNARVALVTGAAGGIGHEITRGLLDAQARVIATDINKDALASLATSLKDHPQASALTTKLLDIGDPSACAELVKQSAASIGPIDILINNGALGMGVIRDDHMTRLVEIDEIEPDVWDRFIRTNLSGAWYLTRATVPSMKQRGWGRLLTITTSMFTMLRGSFHPYGPSKAGLEAMCAGHAKEFEGTGVTVNVVVPGGPADTAMVPVESGLDRASLINPGAMVPPLLWLCSKDADTVTGNRYIAANWDESQSVTAARATSESAIAWPELAGAPVWPGGKPD